MAVRAIALRQLDTLSVRLFISRVIGGLAEWWNFCRVDGRINWLWFGNAEIAAVMAVAMLANLFIAGLSGTLVPLGLLRAGIDPAVASSVFVTTITDIVGFFVFWLPPYLM